MVLLEKSRKGAICLTSKAICRATDFRRFSIRSKMSTSRLRCIKVSREKTWLCILKSDWTSPALQSDTEENVARSLGCLEKLSQSTCFSSCIIWQYLLMPLFFSQGFQTPVAFLQANAGWRDGGEAAEEEKPLWIRSAWRENPNGVHIMWREVEECT